MTSAQAVETAKDLISETGCTCSVGSEEGGTHTCMSGVCWEAIRLLVDDRNKLELGLRNCLAMAQRQIRANPASAEAWLHVVRFCKDAGVVPQILRASFDGPGDTAGADGPRVNTVIEPLPDSSPFEGLGDVIDDLNRQLRGGR